MTSPTPAELRQLIEAAAAVQPCHGLLIALAAMTGARRGELACLRWSDVDLDSGVVHIRRSLRQVGRRLIEGDTKTHQERATALPPEAVEMLLAFRRQIGAILAAAASPQPGCPTGTAWPGTSLP